MRSTRLFAVVLALVMLLSVVPLPAQAQVQNPTKNHNIVIMVDSGGSLKQGITSDPNEYRFSALNMFFDLASNIGDNMCVIDFKGNNRPNDSSDEAMRALIKCFPEEGLTKITDQSQKQDMKDFINKEAGGYTDIGTALLVAAEQLDGKTRENGLDSYIFLFTDGNTEFAPSAPAAYYEKSQENQEKALEIIRENKIVLCAVYLDNEGKENSQNVANLVRKSLPYDEATIAGITDDDLKALKRYERVTNALNLVNTFQNFFVHLSSATNRQLTQNDSFTIPGCGIQEVSLCINTIHDETVVANTRINSLVNSNSGAVSGDVLFDSKSSGASYVIYKLVDLEPGEYRVEWSSPDPNATCQLILGTSFTADIAMDCTQDEIQYDTPITFTGSLSNYGEKLSKSSDYSNFVCTLEIREKNTNNIFIQQQATLNKNNDFFVTYPAINFGSFTAKMIFKCGDLEIASEELQFSVENQAPVAKDATKKISTSFGRKGIVTLDLSKYISDLEDRDLSKLVIEVNASNTYPDTAFEIAEDNSTLTIRGRDGGDGVLLLTIRDTEGIPADWALTIKLVDSTLLVIALFLLAVIALALLFLRYRLHVLKTVSISGTITFILMNPCRIKLDAMECLNKNLFEILSCRKNRLIHILSENSEFRKNAEQKIREFLYTYKEELSSYSFVSVRTRWNRHQLRLVTPDNDQKNRLTGIPLSGDAKKIQLSRDASCTIKYDA